MLAELLLFPLLIALFAGWGLWGLAIFGIKTESLSILATLGMSLFGTVATVLAFFIPLAEPVEISLVIVGAIPFCFRRFRDMLPPLPKTDLKFCLLATLILSGGAFVTFRNDYHWYYLPSFRWLNEFGLVRGTANIDWVLGQMSLFHVIQAALDQTVEPFGRLGVFSTILFLIYVYERKSWLLLIFIPFYFLFFQASSPDLPLVFVSLIVVNELCFFEGKSDYRLLFALSAFVFAVKPVAFWLPLWVLVCAFWRDRRDVFRPCNCWLPAITVAVFITKNFIVSSCLIYPATTTLIDTWWTPDRQVLEMSDLHSSLYSFDLRYGEEDIASFTAVEKIVRFLTLPDPSTVLNYVIFLTAIVFGYMAFRRKLFVYKALFVIAVLKIGLIYYLSSQYRFVLDVFYPMLFLLLSRWNISRKAVLRVSSGLMVAAYLFIAFPKISIKIYPQERLMGQMAGLTASSLLRPDNDLVLEYKSEKIGNITFNVATKTIYSFDTPPPATTLIDLKHWYFMNSIPQWKNPVCPRDGIYVRALSAEEKEHLKSLILEIENQAEERPENLKN
jgi:hypothetical protein